MVCLFEVLEWLTTFQDVVSAVGDVSLLNGTTDWRDGVDNANGIYIFISQA